MKGHMMMTTDKTYNGWSNYATWGVALVLGNDQGVDEKNDAPHQGPMRRTV